MARYEVSPDRSTIVVEAKSSVGPISFAVREPSGFIDATVRDGALLLGEPLQAVLDIPLDALASGNDLYDAELRRRINVRQFPTATVELRSVSEVGPSRYELTGTLTFHGITKQLHGAVNLEIADGRMIVTGERLVDIREFDIPTPTILMLRIFPDVRVHLFVEAERPPNAGGTE